MSGNNEHNYPIKEGILEKDKKFESLLFNIQCDIGTVSHILQDYIYMDANSLAYPVLKKRTHGEFYKDFNESAGNVSFAIDSILRLMPNKKPDDYTLLMKLLDENAPIDFSWFHYNLIIIKCVFETYVDRINHWKLDKEHYEGFHILEGDANFLFEMCSDMSSLICNLYCYKACEYKGYIENKQIEQVNNPFKRYQNMPKRCKSHKAHSRTLLDSCEGVLHRTFYKNDINAVPIMTAILRQMIELRLEECFGIQVICTDETHSSVKKVVGSQYLELPGLRENTVLPVPIEALNRIYGWSSEYVHRGVADYYWLIFYVKQYLLDFILCDAYIEEKYYANLKKKIAMHFDVTVNSVIWRNFPENLKSVTEKRLEEIRMEINNKGFEKFHLLEQKRENLEVEMFIKKRSIVKANSTL